MSPSHAVVWIDHETARVLHIDTGQESTAAIRAHHHHTRQHGSEVRTRHEYFGSVCDALIRYDEVLVTGPRVALKDFHHYIERHRPAIDPRLVGWLVKDRLTDPQLVALAREQFARYDQAGLPIGAARG